jgi:hypothetical protein
MYRKIAGDVTNKTFGMAGLPPALDKAAFCPGSGTIRPGAPNELRVSSCTCSIPIAASTAIRAASFA